MKIACAALIVLRLQKPRLDILPSPARIALRCPMVIVLRLPTQVNHGIDRAASTQHLATRLVATPSIQACLWHGLHCPVEPRRFRHPRDACGALHQWRVIRTTCFQHTDLVLTAFAQPPCQHAPRRPRTNDNIVKYFVHADHSRTVKAPTLRAQHQNLDTIFPAYEPLTREIQP